MGRNIFIGNLAFWGGEAELRQLFEQKEAVAAVTVMRDADTGKSRGFAFVEMSSEGLLKRRSQNGTGILRMDAT